jgi:hypothetical protein
MLLRTLQNECRDSTLAVRALHLRMTLQLCIIIVVIVMSFVVCNAHQLALVVNIV